MPRGYHPRMPMAIREAHSDMEHNRAVGKQVVETFPATSE